MRRHLVLINLLISDIISNYINYVKVLLHSDILTDSTRYFSSTLHNYVEMKFQSFSNPYKLLILITKQLQRRHVKKRSFLCNFILHGGNIIKIYSFPCTWEQNQEVRFATLSLYNTSRKLRVDIQFGTIPRKSFLCIYSTCTTVSFIDL